MSLKPLARSAGVTAAEVLHLVQHLPSKNWSYSGQSGLRQTTSRQSTGSALLFMPTPPLRPLVQERSAGTLTSDKHRGQQVPVLSGATYLKGGLHSMSLQEMPSHVSFAPVSAPGENTGYLAAALMNSVARAKPFIASGSANLQAPVDHCALAVTQNAAAKGTRATASQEFENKY